VFGAAIEALVQGDRDAFTDAHSPQLRADDRRALMARVYGREELINEFVRRPQQFELRMVAGRGDDLELHHARYRGISSGSAWEFEVLGVVQLGPDGRIAETASFDPDDYDAAHAELDRRYLAGEGTGFASTWSRVVAGHQAQNARDWDAFGAGFTRDVVSVDHCYGGLMDRGGREAYVEAVASLTDPFTETRSFPMQILAISDDAVAYVVSVIERAHPEDALPLITLLHVSPEGIDRIETFPVAERAAALAAYERLQP
jgi:hypothetical protein